LSAYHTLAAQAPRPRPTSYPQVLKLSTGYTQVTHRLSTSLKAPELSTGYPQAT